MKNYHIGIEVTMEIISGKWKPLLLCYIQTGINRNGQFLKAIPEISQKVLSEQLRQLEQDGIISRHVFAEVPPHVEYELTEQGQSLTHVLMELCNWGEGHLQDLQAIGAPVKLEQHLKQV